MDEAKASWEAAGPSAQSWLRLGEGSGRACRVAVRGSRVAGTSLEKAECVLGLLKHS